MQGILMRNSSTIKRFLKKDYGPRKMPLPKSLEFLSSINFHAVTEDESSGRITRTVEIKPTTLKRLIEDIDVLLSCIEESDELIKKLKAENRQLKRDNKLLIENHQNSKSLEQEIQKSQDRLDEISINPEITDKLKSENSALQVEIRTLKEKVDAGKSNLSQLEKQRKELEKRCAELEDEKEKLDRVNATILKNTNEGFEPNIWREKNGFFSSDKRFKIINRKPYRGS